MNFARDFSKATIKNLSLKGIVIVGSQATMEGDVLYLLDDNGTGRMRTFSQVLELAK